MERTNLWAPWRLKYIQGLTEKSECFLCDAIREPEKDAENLVLWRTERCIVVFNRFPYNNGHMLIAPTRHVGDLEDLEDGEVLEMMQFVRQLEHALRETIKPHGFNVGINIGRAAGAGLPEHIHMHVVPRWSGDTSYMAVCADIDVISQSLEELYEQLRGLSERENLPGI